MRQHIHQVRVFVVLQVIVHIDHQIINRKFRLYNFVQMVMDDQVNLFSDQIRRNRNGILGTLEIRMSEVFVYGFSLRYPMCGIYFYIGTQVEEFENLTIR